MNAIKINSLSRIAGRAGLILKKYSPEVLLVTGVGGTIISTAMFCKATFKSEQVMQKHIDNRAKIQECWAKVENGEIPFSEYSEGDHKKDLTIVYAQTVVDYTKLFGPSVTLGLASLACIASGYGIFRRRNVALAAAYKVLEEGFASYRKRVVEEYGEERDYMYKNGLVMKQITETEVDADGKTRKVKKNVLAPKGPNELSVYARFFDEMSTEWSKTGEYNLMFLKAQQNYFNNLLLARGHVFLNEVYDALGIPRSSAGSLVGWLVNNDGSGDNYIDFGVFDGDNPRAREFVNGYEKAICLDFNVDGVIYDQI